MIYMHSTIAGHCSLLGSIVYVGHNFRTILLNFHR